MFAFLRGETRTLLSAAGSIRFSTLGQVQAIPAAKRRSDKALKKTSKRLDLPSYKTVDEMRYGTFVQDLQRKNPNEQLRAKDIKNALRGTIVDIVGKDEFRRMEKSSAIDRPNNHWKALIDEGREFWKDKQSQGRR